MSFNKLSRLIESLKGASLQSEWCPEGYSCDIYPKLQAFLTFLQIRTTISK